MTVIKTKIIMLIDKYTLIRHQHLYYVCYINEPIEHITMRICESRPVFKVQSPEAKCGMNNTINIDAL